MEDDAHLRTDLRIEVRHSELRPVYVSAEVRKKLPTQLVRETGIQESFAEGTGARTSAENTSTVRKVPNRAVRVVDFDLTAGRENLAQAVVMRLLTPRGELSELGHPTYGSRLYEVIGRRNLATNLALARLYILESLKQESRIKKINQLLIESAPGSRDRINIFLEVLPANAPAVPISFVLEVPQ